MKFIITIDDADRETLELLLAKAANLPVVIGVPAGLIGKKFEGRETAETGLIYRLLRERNIEIASHGYFHTYSSGSSWLSYLRLLIGIIHFPDRLGYLRRIFHFFFQNRRIEESSPSYDAHLEMVESGSILKKYFGVNIDFFIFPAGQIDNKSLNYLLSNYCFGRGTNIGFNYLGDFFDRSKKYFLKTISFSRYTNFSRIEKYYEKLARREKKEGREIVIIESFHIISEIDTGRLYSNLLSDFEKHIAGLSYFGQIIKIGDLSANLAIVRQQKIEEYAKNVPYYYKVQVPQLLVKYLAGNLFTSLIDCGCGDGTLLENLWRQKYLEGKNVYAIDLSKIRVERTKSISGRFDVRMDNAEELGTIADESIDFFISTQVIEHVDDRKMAENIYRVVKKNGLIYLTTVFKNHYAWYFYRSGGHWALDPTHLREYTEDGQLLKLFGSGKFKLLENEKALIWYPVSDFFLRRVGVEKRRIYNNYLLRFLRKIKVPIVGYYNWEIVLKKIE